jgi:hypothetical protein
MNAALSTIFIVEIRRVEIVGEHDAGRGPHFDADTDADPDPEMHEDGKSPTCAAANVRL